MKSTLFILLDTQASNMNFLINQTSHDFVIHSWLILWHQMSTVSELELTNKVQTELQHVKGVNFTNQFFHKDFDKKLCRFTEQKNWLPSTLVIPKPVKHPQKAKKKVFLLVNLSFE